ncbi:MAG: MarR family transcriptional regulator [Thermotaleaceae bacterium]
MANYYNEINNILDKLIHKVLVYDRKGFKIGIKGEPLSLLDIYILKKIGEGERKKLYELVEEMEIDRGLISSFVQKLILNGYVQKEKSREDKRVHMVKLTALGREMLDKNLDRQEELLNFILSDVTLNEEKTILKFLSKINQTTLSYHRDMELKKITNP